MATKIYLVEYMNYDASYIVAAYTNKKEAEEHANTDTKNLQVIESNLWKTYDKFKPEKYKS